MLKRILTKLSLPEKITSCWSTFHTKNLITKTSFLYLEQFLKYPRVIGNYRDHCVGKSPSDDHSLGLSERMIDQMLRHSFIYCVKCRALYSYCRYISTFAPHGSMCKF